MRGLALLTVLMGLVRVMAMKISTDALWRTFWRLSYLVRKDIHPVGEQHQH